MEWSDVEALVRRRDPGALVGALRDLDATQRKALVAPVRQAVRPSGPEGWPPWDDFPSYAVVGAAALPDARAVVSWLRRFGGLGGSDHEQQHLRSRAYAECVAHVLLDRDASWLPDVVPLLADQLAFDVYDPWAYFLVESLRERLDLDPPTAGPFVRGWVVAGWRNASLPDLLRREPRFASLVPLVVEQDDLAGGMLADWHPNRFDQITAAIDQGLVARDAVMDRLISRLERGGRPAATDQLVKVHDELAPTLDEVAARVGTYVTMLGDPARSTVAGMAQRQLFLLDDAGRLPLERLGDASQLVLVRKEKKLVRAQLSRLKDIARRQPTDLDVLAVCAAAGFGNPAGDLQAAAVKLVGGWWPKVGDAARRTVTELAGGLPAYLAGQLGAGDADVAEPPAAVGLPLVEPPSRVVPLDDPGELAAELRRLWIAVRRNRNAEVDGIMLERVVEAVPRIIGADPAAFRATGRAALEDQTYEVLRRASEWNRSIDENHGLAALVSACVGDPADPPRDLPTRLPAPGVLLARRLLDLADACRANPAVRSVSLPSWSNGSVTADDLAARLALAAAEGWEPDGSDLEQALLRLDLAGADADAFRALGSGAASTVAAWIEKGGLIAPGLEWGTALVDGVDVPMVVVPPGTTSDDAGPLQRLVVAEGPPRMWSTWASGMRFGAWPLMAPHHPELIAIHVAVEQAIARNHASDEVGTLVALAKAPGPVGPALHLAIAYGLAAKRIERQAAAVDAALVLAARGRLDGAGLGALLQDLLERDVIVLKRVVEPLAQAAHAGAAEQVWATLKVLISRQATADLALTGFPDLLTVAAETAGRVADPGAVDGLEELASRKGRSRQVVEAQRLRAVIAARAANARGEA